MSDDKKINWRPPLKLDNYLNSFSKIEVQQTLFDKNSWKKNINYQPQANTIFEIDLKNKKEAEINIAKSLYSDWSEVMKEEAKLNPKRFKPDAGISHEFFIELTAAAKRLNCNPEDLAAVIYKESHFDPQVKGPGGYTGLIQMDKKAFTAAVKYALQTEGDKCKLNPDITYSRYAKLTREEQIKYAEAYLKFRINEKNLKGKISGGQINTLIHRPADINNPNSLDIHQKQVDRVKKIPLKYKQ